MKQLGSGSLTSSIITNARDLKRMGNGSSISPSIGTGR
ncbi:hypothetical protein PLEIONE_272 [Mycobacterium phage Pleione]|uniref:Uncharacterized protein n=3 Tax=Bixzunavirus Bxz1 TaxID=2006134 RepID=T2FIC1_9CAUD|nr:hypothetical protein MOMOMIXON_262 [Mycobacterium phage MoMoMixon]YP_009018010.1 hypothetical protein PLEIONE_272 [Mycobacterium phage Pleione]YP_009221366.1 hypothetical protein AWH68_gp084 [Mycobacterium phage Breeniome]QAY08513.1 hypothetical protein SEA_IOTA_265 [Mycobacterium phage Iota]QFG15311.1 hypothetical protein SEA_TRINITIUM_263 [Mycobacterium phage Trinitium]QYC53492.1 hypothetical protein SEA_DELYLAH_270 [Mycobacterium phage Delylah]AEN79856.1 hypothetical protein PLEIONE_272